MKFIVIGACHHTGTPTSIPHAQNVALLRAEFAAIAELCRPLTEAEWKTPTCLPGWSVQDVVAHLIGIEASLAGEPTPELEGGKTFTAGDPHTPHIRNPFAAANEIWVESMRSWSGVGVLARFSEVTERRLATLDAMTQADYDAPSWTPVAKDETYGRFMRIRHFDCYLHELDIRAVLGLHDRQAPLHDADSLAELGPSLPYVAGKLAGLPMGTTLSITIARPGADPAAVWHLVVADRARLVDSLDGPASFTLTMNAQTFLRLIGGRISAGAATVTVEGDAGLAGQFLSHMAATI